MKVIVLVGFLSYSFFLFSQKDSLAMKDSLKNILLGKFVPEKQEGFVLVDKKYSYKEGLYLQAEVYEAFKQMYEEAKKYGIELKIVSATRTFEYQKTLWEDKYNGRRLVERRNLLKSITDSVERARKILEYTAMPGTSRHHWGTDIDLVSVDTAFFKTAKGRKIHKWLEENAYKYNFCQPYKDKGITRFNGYKDEPWHWSYFPIANKYMELYSQLINYFDLTGFDGCENAEILKVIENYVYSISGDCFTQDK